MEYVQYNSFRRTSLSSYGVQTIYFVFGNSEKLVHIFLCLDIQKNIGIVSLYLIDISVAQ